MDISGAMANKASQCSEQMSHLNESLSILQETVSILEERLSTVLVNQAQKETLAKAAPEAYLVPLASSIRNFNSTVKEIDNRLKELKNRIEL